MFWYAVPETGGFAAMVGAAVSCGEFMNLNTTDDDEVGRLKVYEFGFAKVTLVKSIIPGVGA